MSCTADGHADTRDNYKLHYGQTGEAGDNRVKEVLGLDVGDADAGGSASGEEATLKPGEEEEGTECLRGVEVSAM